jgi:dTMP kinase
MQKGFLISFEGGEGAGKSVQLKRLRDALTQKGFDIVVVREPGGTVISEQIRDVYCQQKCWHCVHHRALPAARAQLYRELILQVLKRKSCFDGSHP